jgi:lipase
MTNIRPFVEKSLPGSDGTTISVAEWPGVKGPLVCVHGLTSSSRAFAGLATELADFHIIAVDCRGRGKSSKSPPFGMARHAADLAAVMKAAEIERATLVGHSMGAYVIGAFHADHSNKVDKMVFVDGGYFLEPSSDETPDAMLESRLGPFLTKIRKTWTSLDEYIGFYETTGLYPNGIDDYGRAHFSYDLAGEPPSLHARIVEACIKPDWRDVLDQAAVGRRLEKIRVPLLMVRAPDGLTGKGDQVVPDEVRDAIMKKVPQMQVVDIPRTNHHTILFSEAGARAVAQEIEKFVS